MVDSFLRGDYFSFGKKVVVVVCRDGVRLLLLLLFLEKMAGQPKDDRVGFY